MPSTHDTAREIATACYGVRARALSRVVSRIYDDELRDLGIKMSQLNVLVYATLRPGSLAVAIGEGLHIEKSTLSRNLARMEVRGWVDTSDGVTVTVDGGRLLRRAASAWRRAQERVVAELGDDASAALSTATADLLG
jgi:DNA-binding MarR family transcriptional regulator